MTTADEFIDSLAEALAASGFYEQMPRDVRRQTAEDIAPLWCFGRPASNDAVLRIVRQAFLRYERGTFIDGAGI